MIKVLSAAALIAGMASASYAGSAAPVQIDEVDTVFAPAPSSAGLALPLAIGGGILAIGLIAGGGDDDAPVATTTGAED